MAFTSSDIERIKRWFKSNKGFINYKGTLSYFDGVIMARVEKDDGKGDIVAVAGIRLKELDYPKQIVMVGASIRCTGRDYFPILSFEYTTMEKALERVNFYYTVENWYDNFNLPTKEQLVWSILA